MEKRTVLAIVLSTIVFIVFQAINMQMNPVSTEIAGDPNSTSVEIQDTELLVETQSEDSSFVDESDELYEEKDIYAETDIYNITFNTRGGVIRELKLKDYKVDVDVEDRVDMVLDKLEDNSLFNITVADQLFNQNFKYTKIDNLTHVFEKSFKLDETPVTLVKTYTFDPDEYLFELKISVENHENRMIPLNSNGSIYSLNVAKQIGPEFKKLDRRDDYRKFSVFTEGKRDEIKTKKNVATYNDSYDWTAIEAKFFTMAIIPEEGNPSLDFSTEIVDGIQKNELTLSRTNTNASYFEDTYKIYAGPKDKNILEQYNSAEENSWGISDLSINKIISHWFLGMFFMVVLEMMNSFIGNYGITIILLTILIKIVLYPITRKSFDSMGKMQAIQPEIKELQDKYKDDSAKLNAAMAELYKKEGVNPLGGCLPMLLQMPIFITFYNLFNEFIGLRGATFIPGWIVDLSRPESILDFGFALPIVGWDALRLLPIIYVASQLISMKFTQNNQAGSAQGANAVNTKMMTLGMPIMFFFIMYNQSSGLLLYWITQNVISSAQQIFSKRRNIKEHELMLEEKAQKKKKKKGKK